ncbi:acyl-coenzyme A diphosphatase NUDT19 [Stomoxys calcitrans]|uniref:acyl-coenzyme A diphosphatase NUDT19 n=1 Tax=Stomoxys calcitrans TaxID=35570 RepID=UPI0027E27A24|nr:acyl-coenzyme A diphosphatase NUDT19 [Stomoxys calcitrans]
MATGDQSFNRYRLSSSLILVAKIGESNKNENYEILMIKRSDQTATIKDQCVFPGGLFESADESEDWLAYFKEFGVQYSDLRNLCPNDTVPRPNILITPVDTKVRREISTRINAIRETFEEVGVLLCCSRQKWSGIPKSHRPASFKYDFDKDDWQERVHNDPREFLIMCQKLQVIPDLWSLYEWAAWASPPTVRKANETVFFITFLSEKPMVKIELSEAKDFLWETPREYLRLKKKDVIGFWPPQYFELSRLYMEKSFDKLLRFSYQRRHMGVVLFMHAIHTCTDGTVSVLPGDDMYPKDPRSLLKPRKLDITMEQFRQQTKRICRIENVISLQPKIHINVQPVCGQLMPWTRNEDELQKSSL